MVLYIFSINTGFGNDYYYMAHVLKEGTAHNIYGKMRNF